MAGLDPAIHVFRVSVLAVIGVILGACGAQSENVRTECEAGEEYFPRGTFQNRYGNAGESYARRLRNAGEPSLSCARATNTEAYRLLWIPSFSSVVVVRILSEMRDYRLEATVMSPANEQILSKITRPLTVAEWHEFKVVMSGTSFWSMTPTSDELPATDGWRWIIEGQSGSRYHAVDRQVRSGTDYEKLGLRFLQLAGIPPSGR
ncbi:hypothetical protein [Ferrovibrio sp.]